MILLLRRTAQKFTVEGVDLGLHAYQRIQHHPSNLLDA